MAIRPLDVVDGDSNIVARLYWSPPNIVRVEADNPALKAFFEEMVQRYAVSGIESITGVVFEINGHKAYGGKRITLTIDTPDFLSGIAECLIYEHFQGQSLTGIIRRWKDVPPPIQEHEPQP